MAKKGKIAHYRQKLDHTLASHDLTNKEKLESLVKDQISQSLEDENRGYADNVIKKRAAEMSNVLEMFRSASENYEASSDKTQHASWKLKQDNEEFRVMYREGPLGSPFHSLLVEGYIDAPLDVCLCVAWEATLYQRWFPEMFIPTFKVAIAKSLKKVRISEEISLIRVKLSWPMSSREAIFHYFEFEYLKDGLIIVLINTIPDVADIKMETHGFTNDGIPEAENTVRIDFIGGFALQKVTDDRSYFRTIGTMDIKLDFVPPSLINFISRQLIGTGFRFFQKMVASIAKGDDEYSKTLNDPLYVRIREAMLSNSKSKRYLENQTNDEEQTAAAENVSRKKDVKVLSQWDQPSSNEIEEENTEENTPDIKCNTVLALEDTFKVEDQKIIENGHVNGHAIEYKPATEIEEEETEVVKNPVESYKVKDVRDAKEEVIFTDQRQLENLHKNVPISPEVKHALGDLDKMITIVRGGKLKTRGWEDKSGSKIALDKAKEEILGISMKEETIKASGHVPTNDNLVDGLRSEHSDFGTRMTNHDSSSLVQLPPVTNSSRNSTSVGSSPAFVSPMTMEVDGIHENSPTKTKKTGQPKKWRLCCLHLISGKLVS